MAAFTYRTSQAIQAGDKFNDSINSFRANLTEPQPVVSSVTGPVITNQNPLLTVVTNQGTFVTPQPTLILSDPKFGGNFAYVVGQ